MIFLLQCLRRMFADTGIGRLPGLEPLYRLLFHSVRPHGITQISTKEFPLFINAEGGGLHRVLLEQGVYEPETAEAMRALLKPGMVMVDIGSNIGYFSVLCGKIVGPQGRILCFEPSKENLDLLRRNIHLHGLCDRTTIVPSCVGAKSENVTLHLDSTNQGNHSLSATNIVQEQGAVTVPCTTLDTYLTLYPLPRIDLIKMDVQGAELQVLHGAMRTLKTYPTVRMIIEFWPFGLRNTGADPEEVLQILREAGFHFRDTEHMGESIDHYSNEQLIERCEAKRQGRGWINLLAEHRS